MKIEQLDDLPFLGEQLVRSRLSEQFDEYFPDHGHWLGITGGKLAVGWLMYIISEADHRLSHTEDWAASRLQTLGAILGETEIRSIDFSDDRLGRLLERYGEDDAWAAFEKNLSSQLLQVYQINDSDKRPKIVNEDCKDYKIVRTDSFNAPQFRDVTELFTHGYSKQRRSDQPFCKIMTSTLDPLSLPLAIEIIKGGGPDSDHYMPNIKRVQSILSERGNLYVGDSLLGTMNNRIAIHTSGDYYLMPLNRKQCRLAELHGYLDQIEQPIETLPSIFTDIKQKRSPTYFKEISVQLKVSGESPEDSTDSIKETEWTERRILVYSVEYAQSLIKSYNNRLDEAQRDLQNLMIHKSGHKVPKTLEDLHIRKDRIIQKYELEGSFEMICTQTVEYVKVQRHKTREAETRELITLHLEVKRDNTFIEKHIQRLGWQVYGTNVPSKMIETSTLVTCYRDEYRIEHLFDYWINKCASFFPLFLKKENRVKGLIRLISVAVRYGILIQHQVRVKLAQNKESISGLYAGNKGRSTAAPTITMIQRSFRGVALVWLDVGNINVVQMTSLTTTQKKLLECLGVSDCYERILELLKTSPILRET